MIAFIRPKPVGGREHDQQQDLEENDYKCMMDLENGQ
jgi:hypothetical protein